MYRIEQIRTVHLEISTLCNARCPMCLRNVNGGKTNPLLPLTDLRLEAIQRIFSTDFLRGLRRIYLCGNYGDPVMGRDTLAAFRYFRENNPELRLDMMTNGSAREPGWWAELARLGVGVYFGVDGSDRTSEVYRRQTSFDTVMRNAAAFIAAGGAAHWDYIIFRHNEHQVEEARALSERMGFRSFRPKKTGRFFSHGKSEFKDSHEVWNEAGEVEYLLEKPLSPAYRNPSLEREAELGEKFGSFDAYLDRTPVNCKVAAEKSLFVSAEGLVFPCCWTAIRLYAWNQERGRSEMEALIAELPDGINELSALRKPLAEVLAGEFFQRLLPERWQRPSVREGKLKVCARLCGEGFDPFGDQFNRKEAR